METNRAIIIVLLLVCAVALDVTAVSEEWDDPAELEQQLEGATGADRIGILNRLARAYTNRDPEKQIRFADEALSLARQHNDRQGEAHALFSLGCGYLDQNQADKALASFNGAAELYEALGDVKRHFDSINNAGWVYENMGELDRALEQYQQALSLAREKGFDGGEAIALQYIGINHLMEDRIDTGLEYLLQSLRIHERLGGENYVANLQNSIGSVYCELGEHAKGLEYYRKSLVYYEEHDDVANLAIAYGNIGIALEAEDKTQEALESYRKSMQYAKQIGDTMSVGRTADNMAGLYVDLGDFTEAHQLYEQALKIWRDIGNEDQISTTLGNIGEMYLQQKRWDLALQYLDESLELASRIESIRGQRNGYLNRSIVYEELGRFKEALDDYHRSVELDKQILDAEKQETIAELEAEYENESKRRHIELLEKDLEIQRLQLSRARFRIGAMLCGFLLLGVVLAVLLRRYLHLLAFWKKKHYISHYKLERQIGSGGMGVVYLATDLMDRGKSVALKVIRDELAEDPAQRKRFLNEAYVVDKLNHPNIIKVYERGEHQQTLYIAMELLQGTSLAELIHREERLPLEDCVRIMRQLGEALVQIHRQGIQHRDVKPENVMIVGGDGGEQVAKLLDFGLARAPSLTRLTESGEILGTVTYLSPEQITERRLSPAADIYALGVVFYELLTQEKPFWGDNPGEIVRAILDSKPLPPIRFRPELPERLSSLIMRMLDKIPEQRPTGDDLVAMLAM